MSQKVAYVTGGMGGIGTAICQRLHKDGFKVIAGCGPTRDHAKWLAEQKALGFTFYASVGNVGDWDSTVEAFTQAKAEHGTIDVLVTDQGIAVNPNRPELKARFIAAQLPVVEIEALQQRAELLTGKPQPLQFEDKTVAFVHYRDGSIIDVIKQVKSL